eukprot:1157459-Pelagomonas_calceolata.AAC.13
MHAAAAAHSLLHPKCLACPQGCGCPTPCWAAQHLQAPWSWEGKVLLCGHTRKAGAGERPLLLELLLWALLETLCGTAVVADVAWQTGICGGLWALKGVPWVGHCYHCCQVAGRARRT